MLKKLSEESYELIKEKIMKNEIKISKITSENIWDIFDFFEMIEISFSNDIDNGIEVDRKMLKKVCNIVDELNIQNDDDAIDIEDINKRLGFI